MTLSDSDYEQRDKKMPNQTKGLHADAAVV
jgi:hypothetical protein